MPHLFTVAFQEQKLKDAKRRMFISEPDSENHIRAVIAYDRVFTEFKVHRVAQMMLDLNTRGK